MNTKQIENIKSKLSKLKSIDKNHKVFGADTHLYKMNPPMKLKEVTAFQKEHSVQLPESYIQFITQIGDGGAGPFYGLNSLEDSIITYYDENDEAKTEYFGLSQPFPHTEIWNIESELKDLYAEIEAAEEAKDEALSEKLHEKKWDMIGAPNHDYGRINISDYGCGVQISLVVNGSEKGNIWTDDRTNDAGLYPSIELGNADKLNFLDWYELWLDNSLAEVNAK